MVKIKKNDIKKIKPPKDGLYLVFLHDSMKQRNYYRKKDNKWFSFIEKAETTEYVTHWIEKC